MKVLQKVRGMWRGRAEVPEVPGRYENAVPVPEYFAALAYRTHRRSGCGYECPYRTYGSSRYG